MKGRRRVANVFKHDRRNDELTNRRTDNASYKNRLFATKKQLSLDRQAVLNYKSQPFLDQEFNLAVRDGTKCHYEKAHKANDVLMLMLDGMIP